MYITKKQLENIRQVVGFKNPSVLATIDDIEENSQNNGYEIVNEFFRQCENIALDCDANQDCHKCALQGSPINCDADYFEITEHQFNQIMNYERKPKSQQMLEDLGFTKEPKATFFNLVSLNGSFSSVGVDDYGTISLSVHTDIWDNCKDAIEQFVKDVKGGFYD